MSIPISYQQWLAQKGIALTEFGLQEVALRRSDALKAIDILLKYLVPVLGGDVYFLQDSKLIIAYANWYCEPKTGDQAEDFALRSCAKAAEYVKRFPDQDGKEVLFVLVAKK